MEENVNYTLEQFNAATVDLKEILVQCEFPPMEVNTIIEFCGIEPMGHTWKASNNGYLHIHVQLQDDGTEPYAVAEVKLMQRKKCWWAACFITEVGFLYPHQFKVIPDILKHLESLPAVPELPLDIE